MYIHQVINTTPHFNKTTPKNINLTAELASVGYVLV
jgi:hypothetical protein